MSLPTSLRKRENGFSLVAVLICIFIASLIAISALGILQIHRYRTRQEILRTTRNSLASEIESALQSSFTIEASLNNQNSSSQNPKLDACIKAKNPASCDSNLGFFLALPDSTTRVIAGPPRNESFYNFLGEPCDPQEEDCTFASRVKLKPSCPAAINPCPFVKIFEVEYEIQPQGELLGPLAPASDPTFIRYSFDLNQTGYSVLLVN